MHTLAEDQPVRSSPVSASSARFAADDSFHEYRAVSRLAVVSCLLGLMSLVALFDVSLAVIPALGLGCGLLSLWKIRARSEELTGESLALVGIVLCVLFWTGGWSWLGYNYMTEAPADARRITYDELQPGPDAPEAVPVSAQQLDGQRVFIKGFMYPGPQSRDIREFVLCYNNDDCCFGGSPKLTHMIYVRMKPPLTVDYSTRQKKVVGTFRLGQAGPIDGLKTGAIYNIDADDVK